MERSLVISSNCTVVCIIFQPIHCLYIVIGPWPVGGSVSCKNVCFIIWLLCRVICILCYAIYYHKICITYFNSTMDWRKNFFCLFLLLRTFPLASCASFMVAPILLIFIPISAPARLDHLWAYMFNTLATVICWFNFLYGGISSFLCKQWSRPPIRWNCKNRIMC